LGKSPRTPKRHVEKLLKRVHGCDGTPIRTKNTGGRKPEQKGFLIEEDCSCLQKEKNPRALLETMPDVKKKKAPRHEEKGNLEDAKATALTKKGSAYWHSLFRHGMEKAQRKAEKTIKVPLPTLLRKNGKPVGKKFFGRVRPFTFSLRRSPGNKQEKGTSAKKEYYQIKKKWAWEATLYPGLLSADGGRIQGVQGTAQERRLRKFKRGSKTTRGRSTKRGQALQGRSGKHCPQGAVGSGFTLSWPAIAS